jgi:hypothetical protein
MVKEREFISIYVKGNCLRAMIVSWLGGPQYTTYGFEVQRNAIIHNGVVLAEDQIIKRIRKDIKVRLLP